MIPQAQHTQKTATCAKGAPSIVTFAAAACSILHAYARKGTAATMFQKRQADGAGSVGKNQSHIVIDCAYIGMNRPEFVLRN